MRMQGFLRIKYLESLFNRFLKMLVILAGIPVTAPGKAMFLEKAVAQVALIYLVSKILTTVCIDFAAFWGNVVAAVFISAKDDIGVVERINIDCQPIGMFGKAVCTVHNSVIKAGGVVIHHR